MEARPSGAIDPMSTRLLIIAAAAVLILGGALGVTLISKGTSDAGGKALIGGPFKLVDQTGRAVTEKDFEGSFMIAYFGYTFCPDFCPLGLSPPSPKRSNSWTRTRPEAITPVFFSVDPARDTVEQLAEYVAEFSPPHDQRLTGTEERGRHRRESLPHLLQHPPGEIRAKTTPSITPPSSTSWPLTAAIRTHFSHSATPEEVAERLKNRTEKSLSLR